MALAICKRELQTRDKRINTKNLVEKQSSDRHLRSTVVPCGALEFRWSVGIDLIRFLILNSIHTFDWRIFFSNSEGCSWSGYTRSNSLEAPPPRPQNDISHKKKGSLHASPETMCLIQRFAGVVECVIFAPPFAWYPIISLHLTEFSAVCIHSPYMTSPYPRNTFFFIEYIRGRVWINEGVGNLFVGSHWGFYV